jgi:uncharacterized protein
MIKREQYQDVIGRLFPEQGKKVKTITFAVTDNCNLRCNYCYQTKKENNVMSFETAKEFIDSMLENAKKEDYYLSYSTTSGVIVEFIGGEPLLETDLILQIMNYFCEQLIVKNSPLATKFVFNITSNGVLFNTPKVQQMINKYKGRITISITVDGNKELHDSCRVFPDGSGSYDLAIEAALMCKEEYDLDGTKITLAPANIQYTSSAIIHMIELGYKSVYANCVYEDGWTKEHALIFYNELKIVADYIISNNLENSIHISTFDENFFSPMEDDDLQNWCGGLVSMLALDQKGNLFPCIRYMENSLDGAQEPLIIGTIKDGIAQTEEHKKILESLNKVDRRTQSTDECFNCPIAFGCGWCSAYNYQVYGTVDKRVIYICIMHKARALANAYLFKTLYKMGKGKEYRMYITDEMALEVINEEELNLLKGI